MSRKRESKEQKVKVKAAKDRFSEVPQLSQETISNMLDSYANPAYTSRGGMFTVANADGSISTLTYDSKFTPTLYLNGTELEWDLNEGSYKVPNRAKEMVIIEAVSWGVDVIDKYSIDNRLGKFIYDEVKKREEIESFPLISSYNSSAVHSLCFNKAHKAFQIEDNLRTLRNFYGNYNSQGKNRAVFVADYLLSNEIAQINAELESIFGVENVMVYTGIIDDKTKEGILESFSTMTPKSPFSGGLVSTGAISGALRINGNDSTIIKRR